ncbi:MAG: hypothetical protein CM15mP128_4780 [Methanobacteriota archaeon]|nr:MAG: hypothetical protein CM15mP128_4780 [Euryarchaeota archaeon]
MACTKRTPKRHGIWGTPTPSSNYNGPPGLGSGTTPSSGAQGHGPLSEASRTSFAPVPVTEGETPAALTRPSPNGEPAPKSTWPFAEAMAPGRKCRQLRSRHFSSRLMNPFWELWGKNTATGEITPADDNTLLLVKIMEDAFEASEAARVDPACHPYCHALELSLPFL